MRGGIRQGAGRKPSELTVRVSVPVGVLDEVNNLILAYKQGGLIKYQEIKHDALNVCHEIKPDDLLIDCQEIKSDDSLIDNQEIKDAVKALQGLSPRTCKALRKSFGTLRCAASKGVRAEPDGGINFPTEVQHLLRTRLEGVNKSV